MKVMKAIILFSVFLSIAFFLYLKVLAQSDLPNDVRKNGYCILNYGSEYKNQRGTNNCIIKNIIDIEPITFTEDEFKEYCPKPKLLSIKINSDCFKASPGLN